MRRTVEPLLTGACSLFVSLFLACGLVVDDGDVSPASSSSSRSSSTSPASSSSSRSSSCGVPLSLDADGFTFPWVDAGTPEAGARCSGFGCPLACAHGPCLPASDCPIGLVCRPYDADTFGTDDNPGLCEPQ